MIVAPRQQVEPVSQSRLRVLLLDVGHGNCAIAQDGREVAVIDAPKTPVLPQCLAAQANPTVRRLVLSHADQDHIGGAAALLAHEVLSVQELWINPNSQQYSKTYLDLLTAARDRHRRGDLQVSTNLNIGVGRQLSFGRVEIQVLHPDILYAGVGPTGAGHPWGRITGNGMSAVLRVSLAGLPAVLLPGDMDARAFEVLVDSGSDLATPVLVFPHHGGSAHGGSDREFAARLCEVVQPQLIVFSIGRRRLANPSPEIVAGIRATAPGAHIACTQLSRHCHGVDISPAVFDHVLADLPAAGLASGACCAGSLSIERGGTQIMYRPLRANHSTFIDGNLASPLCKATPVIPKARTPTTTSSNR